MSTETKTEASEAQLEEGTSFYILTEGSYSNYGILGLYQGKPGIDLKQLAEQWKALPLSEKPGDHVPNRYCPEGVMLDSLSFAKYVQQETGLVPLAYQEIWGVKYLRSVIALRGQRESF